MSVHWRFLGVVMDVETLMEVLSAHAMKDTKHIMMIPLFVLV